MTVGGGPRFAVVLALARASDGGAAALLPSPDGVVMLRTLRQLEGFGFARAVIVTRPEWADGVRAAVVEFDDVAVVAAATVAEALRCVASQSAAGEGASVTVVDGEVVAHDAVYDALLNDPRVRSGVVVSRPDAEPLLRLRVERGRMVAAETAYHRAAGARAVAVGVLTSGAGDAAALATVAGELAGLLSGARPPGWDDELDTKARRWAEAGWIDVERARATAAEDVASLLLMGLARRGVAVAAVGAGPFPSVRVFSPQEATAAVEAARLIDTDALRLAAVVKSRDGFVTTHLVSPYSKYLARWAASRGLRPNQVTVFSMALGVAAALLFALGSRAGFVAGGVVLWAAFVADCVDGQLARYTRQFSKLGAWLDALFDRAKEYVVFAGLAVGGVRAGDDRSIWVLAAAALALQVTRHAIAFSYGLSQRPPARAFVPLPLEDPGNGEPHPASTVAADTALLAEDQPQSRSPWSIVGQVGVGASRFFEQRAWLKWAKRIFVLPIGERFLAIAVTAALWGPRTVFVVLLVWGGLALGYTAAGRLLRSVV